MHRIVLSLKLREMLREVFQVEMGSLYHALCRMEERGWIRGDWSVSDANRKVRYYSLAPMWSKNWNGAEGVARSGVGQQPTGMIARMTTARRFSAIIGAFPRRRMHRA